MMAVRVRTEDGFDFDRPTVLFESDHVADQFGNPNYNVGDDGRFIMIRGGQRGLASPDQRGSELVPGASPPFRKRLTASLGER
jgi:hypothetical protein